MAVWLGYSFSKYFCLLFGQSKEILIALVRQFWKSEDHHMPRLLPYNLLARCLGLLLLVASGLKLQGLAVDPIGRMGLFSTPEFQLAVVEFEVFLAVWLLWGKGPLGSWFLALA